MSDTPRYVIGLRDGQIIVTCAAEDVEKVRNLLSDFASKTPVVVVPGDPSAARSDVQGKVGMKVSDLLKPDLRSE